MASPPASTEECATPISSSASRLHLLLLPAEIRMMILERCLVQRGKFCLRVEPRGVVSIEFSEYDLAPAVLRVCKQLFIESGSLLYTHNIFKLSPYVPISLRMVQPLGRLVPEKNFHLMSRAEINIGGFQDHEIEQQNDPRLSPSLCDELDHVISEWSWRCGLRWVNCKIEDSSRIHRIGAYFGMTRNEVKVISKKFRYGHPNGSHDNPMRLKGEKEQEYSDYIFKLSALRVARTLRGIGADFPCMYRAVQPLKRQCVQRSIILTTGPIELMKPGLHDIHEIKHVSSVTNSI